VKRYSYESVQDALGQARENKQWKTTLLEERRSDGRRSHEVVIRTTRKIMLLEAPEWPQRRGIALTCCRKDEALGQSLTQPEQDSAVPVPTVLHRGMVRIWGGKKTESQNHRIAGVGRDLCGSSSPTPLPKQGHPQQAAQDRVQAGLEYLQRRRLHNLPATPALCLIS